MRTRRTAAPADGFRPQERRGLSRSDLYELAKGSRTLLGLEAAFGIGLLSFVGFGLALDHPSPHGLVILATGLLMVIALAAAYIGGVTVGVVMMTAMGWSAPLIGGGIVAMVFWPTFPLVLAVIHVQTLRHLADAGLRVGVVGVRRIELAKFSDGVCLACGYDLSGIPRNGLCPECGGG